MLTAIKNQPGKGEYYFRLGLIELETDNPQSALDNFNRAIKLDPKKPSYSLLRAAALFKLTNLTDGLDEISRFLTLEPSSKQIKNGQLIISGLMGLFCGTKGKIDPIMKKAIEYLEKADQPLATIDILDSIETTSPHMPMLHTIRGLAKFKLSNLSGAIQEFEQGKVNYPLCPDNYLYLGFVYTSLQKPEKARLYLKETLRLDPFNQKAYQWLAKIEIKARRFMLARKWLKILTVLEPDVISHHHRLGQVLLETGESHLAESIFLDIIEKDKKHSGALIQLGQLFLEKRKKAANQKEKDDLAQKAQEYLHQALSINPENEPVKKMLHDLKKH